MLFFYRYIECYDVFTKTSAILKFYMDTLKILPKKYTMHKA